MAKPLTAEDLIQEANALNYKIVLNKETGNPRMIPPSSGRSPAFERQLKANKGILKAYFTTPKTVKDRLKDTSGESWLGQVNHKINEYRDRFVTPGVEAAGGFVGRHSWLADLPGVNTPEDATKLGGGIAREAEKTIVPDSATGKGINAALALTGGESAEAEEGLGALRTVLGTARGRVGIPALVGGVTGGLSGEGTVPGVIQGTGAGLAGELPRAAGHVANANATLRRAERQYQKDDIDPGVRIGQVLKLKTFDDQFTRYKNWVRALKDGRVGREAGERYAEGMENIVDSIRGIAMRKAQALKNSFMDKMHVPFNPRKHDYSPEMMKEYQAVREEYEKTLKEASDLIRGMRKERALRREVYKPTGAYRDTAMKESSKYAGQTPREALNQTAADVKAGLQKLHPALAGTYDAVKEEYRMYKGFHDIADINGSIQSPSGHVDLDAINHELDANPKRFQSRLGDDNWDAARSLFRRGAPDAPNYQGEGFFGKNKETFFDRPGELSKMRTMIYGTKGHAAASAETMGSVLGGAPLVTKPVGKLNVEPKSPMVNRIAKQLKGKIPRLITGAAANEGEEKVRDASGQ